MAGRDDPSISYSLGSFDSKKLNHTWQGAKNQEPSHYGKPFFRFDLTPIERINWAHIMAGKEEDLHIYYNIPASEFIELHGLNKFFCNSKDQHGAQNQ